ncbi:MAG TPA: hypothetical protein VKA06_06305 [Spirochaetia bacterium]|nr:hypothetical protein [Spirochaetia bacterium]
MTQRDERIDADVRRVEGKAFVLLKWGVFAVLVVRWFVLGQTLAETWDFFAVWVVASLFEYFMYALRGVPMSYPVPLNRRDQLVFLATVPVVTGLLPVLILHLRGALTGWGHALGIFGRTYIAMLALFALYRAINAWWERRSLK